MLPSKTDYSDLQTDAIAEPPRRKNVDTEFDPQSSSNGRSDIIASENLGAKVDESIPIRPVRKKQSSRHENILSVGAVKCGRSSETVNGTSNVINVVNSNHVHIGSLFNYNINNIDSKSKKVKDEKNKKGPFKKDIEESETIRAVKLSIEKCTIKDIDIVKTHLGKNWKTIFRKLNYSEGEIDQLYIDHSNGGLSEVIYQGLLDWTRNNADDATLGKLCTILWNEDYCELVEKLASN